MTGRASTQMLRAGALSIAALAALRCLVSITPMMWFDVDPRLNPAPFAGIGIDTSMLLDLLTLAASGLVLLTAACRREAGMDLATWLMILMAPAALVLVVCWAPSDIDHLWRGANTMAALMGAIALMVACRADEADFLRRTVLGILVGVAGALLVRGFMQLLVEHPDTVEYFHAHRAEVLASNGWDATSHQAAVFERRLSQAEATAWFGFSNIYSSIIGACLLITAVTAFAMRRTEGSWKFVLAACAAGAFALEIQNGSKGALGALAIGALFIAWVRRRNAPSPEVHSLVAIGAVVLVWIAVVARGFMGERLLELSLLFRWHYLVGAVEMLKSHWLTGVGPDGFQGAYLLARPLASPEEVNSAHNALLDWMAAYGIAGVGIGAAVLTMVGMVGGSAARLVRSDVDRSSVQSADCLATSIKWSCLVLLFCGAIAIAWESPSLGVIDLAARVAGVVAALALGVAVIIGFAQARTAMLVACCGAGVMIVVHSQLEMVLFQHGSACWALALLGVGAAAFSPAAVAGAPLPIASWRVTVTGPVAAIPAVLAAFLIGPAVESFRQESRVESAAQIASTSIAHSAADLVVASQSPPRARLAIKGAEYHNLAARELLDSAQAQEAAHQSRAAIAAVSPYYLHGHLAARARVAHAAATQALVRAGELAWTDSAAAFESALELDRRNTQLWIRLAESRALSGDRTGAVAAIMSAIHCDDSYRLDALRQLTPQARAALESRQAELESNH